VSNTILSGNFNGINLQPLGTEITVTASFEQVQAIHNLGSGFDVVGSRMTGGTLSAIAADTLASGNGGAGFFSTTQAGHGITTFVVTNSKAANNQVGVENAVGTAMFLNGSTISGNGWGFLIASGGVINSYGNNAITDTTNSGILTAVSLQ